MRARWFLPIMIVLAPAARGETMSLAWPTWLRAEPDGRVLDELQAGRRIEVERCEGGWCRTHTGGAPGWVARTALSAAAPRALARGGGPCLPAEHYTPAGPIPLRICPAR